MAYPLPLQSQTSEEPKLETPPAQKSTTSFSWDRFLLEGQEKLASFIDIEGPEAVLNHEKSATASMDFGALSPMNTKDSETSSLNSFGSMSASGLGKSKDKKYESSMDRMKRTIKRYSESTKESLPDPESSTTSLASKKPKPPKETKKKKDEPPEAQTMMDKLMDKLVISALPTAAVNTKDTDWRSENMKGKPQFSINIMGTNFRKMTARTGVIYETMYTAIEIFSWKNPFYTLSALSIYSYLVLNPRLIPIAPLLFISFRIMVPAYIYRHPPDPTYIKPANPIPAPGPPLAEAVVPKPVPEISREFFYNVVDTQNAMVEYVDAFDGISECLQRFAFFDADECTSSFVYTVLVGSSVVLYILLPYLIEYVPWRLFFVLLGWVGAGFTHPMSKSKVIQPMRTQIKATKEKGKRTLEKMVSSTRSKLSQPSTEPPILDQQLVEPINDHDSDSESENEQETLKSKYNSFWKKVDSIAYHEFNFYEPHEQREVEMFEVQYSFKSKRKNHNHKQNLSVENAVAAPSEEHADNEAQNIAELEHEVGHWQPSLFSNHPYLPVLRGTFLPPTTVTSSVHPELTQGATALSEVLAPPFWQFVPGANWKLDLDADSWVQARGIPVDEETGEAFVMVDSDEKWVYDKHPTTTARVDDAYDADDKQGKPKIYIRRRRWSRICTRHIMERGSKA